MGPRKKAKPNPKAEADEASSTQVAPEAIPLPVTPGASEIADTPTDSQSIAADQETQRSTSAAPSAEVSTPTPSTKSWLGGTWPRGAKAAPITRVAKESITSAGKLVSDVAEAAAAKRPHTPLGNSSPLRASSVYLSGKLGSSSRSLPISATTTKVNVSSSNLSRPPQTARRKSLEGKPEQPAVAEDNTAEEKVVAQARGNNDSEQHEVPQQSQSAAGEERPQLNHTENQVGWRGWFAREGTGPRGSTQSDSGSQKAPEEQDTTAVVEPNIMPAGGTDSKSAAHESTTSADDAVQSSTKGTESNSKKAEDQVEPQPSRSWLPIWSSSGTASHKSATAADNMNAIAAKQEESVEASPKTEAAVAEIQSTGASSGWTFWSRGNARPATSDGISQATVGKLAVANSSSESQPENAIVGGHKRGASLAPRSLKRERPQSLQALDNTTKPSTSATNANGNSAVAVQTPPKAESTKPLSTKPLPDGTPSPQNLILPPLKQTYKAQDSPGLLEQLRNLLYVANPASPKHVSLLEKPLPIKRALAIGVHGYFPAPLLRSVLGQPTGTSIKFAESAATAIQKWTKDHGHSCEVEKVALEGEGKIEERVDLLWKLLLNWIEAVRKADFILVACHSQGVPVATMLVAKLISFGCVHGGQRIGICAMAGVNLGPFADYKSRWISGSAGELFEFARPDSTVSKDYEAALDRVLKYGVKIVYIGSIDDQLVSLEVDILSFCIVYHP